MSIEDARPTAPGSLLRVYSVEVTADELLEGLNAEAGVSGGPHLGCGREDAAGTLSSEIEIIAMSCWTEKNRSVCPMLPRIDTLKHIFRA